MKTEQKRKIDFLRICLYKVKTSLSYSFLLSCWRQHFSTRNRARCYKVSPQSKPPLKPVHLYYVHIKMSVIPFSSLDTNNKKNYFSWVETN